jgi:hypothetical protein
MHYGLVVEHERNIRYVYSGILTNFPSVLLVVIWLIDTVVKYKIMVGVCIGLCGSLRNLCFTM